MTSPSKEPDPLTLVKLSRFTFLVGDQTVEYIVDHDNETDMETVRRNQAQTSTILIRVEPLEYISFSSNAEREARIKERYSMRNRIAVRLVSEGASS